MFLVLMGVNVQSSSCLPTVRNLMSYATQPWGSSSFHKFRKHHGMVLLREKGLMTPHRKKELRTELRNLQKR